jgi:hypothetical protein
MRAPYLVAIALALAGCEKRSPTPAPAPAPSTAPAALGSAQSPPPVVVVPEVQIASQGSTKVHVAWKLPPGTGVNDGAPFRVHWTTSDGLERAPDEMRAKGADVQQGFDVTVTPMPGTPGAALAGEVSVVVCDVATHRVCVPVRRDIEMSFRVAGDVKSVDAIVPLPEAQPR